MDYKQAGVDIEEGYRAVGKYREHSKMTLNDAVLNGIGSFAGMYSLGEFFRGAGMLEDPVLVSSTDGVGTKLDIAFRMKKYGTVGIDCVAMCVNDVICHGARPLFFLDYLACDKLDANVAAEIVKGVAIGCQETGSVLLGGETAEMPGFYEAGKYDIAGFSVGIADRKKIVDGTKIREGDILVGIASSGPHSNGYSLIRKVLPNLDEDFEGVPIGMALLEPTRLYARPVLGLMERIDVRGMAHITGGGFYENIPRMFPAGEKKLAAAIREWSWTVPPIFSRIAAGCYNPGCSGPMAQKLGASMLNLNDDLKKQMFSVFNMGIGFVLAIAPDEARTAVEYLESMGFSAWEIGYVEKAAGQGAEKQELRFV